jgi:hypothetical protein
MRDWEKRLSRVGAAAGAAVMATAWVTACSQSQNGGTALDHNDSSAISTHYLTVQPPYYPTGISIYRENLNAIEAAHVLGLNTTSFFWQNGRTDPYFWCPSRGGAVPNTAQLTNPQYVQPDPNASNGSVIISNMDPDGVYPPTNSSGTAVVCIDSRGRDYFAYAEGEVTQFSAAATWDFSANHGHGGIVVTGAPAMPVCEVTYASVPQSGGGTKREAVTECTAPKGSVAPRVGAADQAPAPVPVLTPTAPS